MAFTAAERAEVVQIIRAALGIMAPPGGPPAAHAASHQNGGSDEVNVAGLSGLLADPQTPAAHASSHEDGGSDELDLTNLAALPDAEYLIGVADPNLPNGRVPTDSAAIQWDFTNPGQAVAFTPAGIWDFFGAAAAAVAAIPVDDVPGTPSLRTLGTGAQQAAAGDDPRLSDDRDPLPHASTHAPAGTDPLPADSVVTATIADDAVTLPKIADIANHRVLANDAGVAASPTALAIGTILDFISGFASQGNIIYRGAATAASLTAGTSGQWLETRGGSANPIWSSPPGRRLSVTILSSGSGTYTVPAGVTSLEVLCLGGGAGGGGAAHAASSSAAGGGGGSGSPCWKRFTSLAGSYSYAVGAGGAGGTAGANDGTDGGDTTFSTMTAKGGLKGLGSAASAVALIVAGGSSVISTGGDWNGAGQSGLFGLVLAGAGPAVGGQGGSNQIGGGGIARISQSNGTAGVGPGAGGAGGVTINGGGPGTTKSGGAGQNGLIVILEYS